MGKLLNIKYGCIHGTYWMYYGVAGSFASAFLLARGYSNAEIGIILAVGNILAVFLQPLIADLADRSKSSPYRSYPAFCGSAHGADGTALCDEAEIRRLVGSIYVHYGVDDNPAAPV